MKLPEKIKPYEEYLEEFVGLTTVGSQIVNYGKLKDYNEISRIFTLNPFKGQCIKEGKLINALIDGNEKVEIPGNQGIHIFNSTEELIEKYCENGNSVMEKEQVTK
jgi:hypothetical protein